MSHLQNDSIDTSDHQTSYILLLSRPKSLFARMELNDDDIELTGGIRSTQNRTSPRRRYLSTTVHDSIKLRAIRERASRLR